MPSTARQSSPSQSLSRIAQLTWHFRASVSQRAVFVVVLLYISVQMLMKGFSSEH